MIEDTSRIEERQTNAVAQEYIGKGYAVSRDVLLDFFPDFRADLVAEKADEKRVIEVKTASSLRKDPSIHRLRNAVCSKPGWDFVLILVGEREKLASPDGAAPFEREDILLRTAEAKRVLEAGFPEAATLLAWSASESAVRLLLREEGVAINRITNSGYTIGRAFTEGAISWDDSHYLEEVEKYRNSIIHGFTVDDFDGQHFVKGLIKTTHRLLDELEAVQSGNWE